MFDTNDRPCVYPDPVTAWHCSTVPHACPHYSLRRRRTCFPCVTHTADLSGCTAVPIGYLQAAAPAAVLHEHVLLSKLSASSSPCQSHCVARQEERRSVSRPSHSNSHTLDRRKKKKKTSQPAAACLACTFDKSSTCAAAAAASRPIPVRPPEHTRERLGVPRTRSLRSQFQSASSTVPQQKRRAKNPSGQVNLHAAVVLTGCVGVGAQFTILFYPIECGINK